MDAMLGAIKARKSKDSGLMDEPMVNAKTEQANPLHALVLQLSPEQKEELMQLLADSQNVDEKAIERGEPSPTERAEVAAQADEENAEMPEETSDDIAMSMIDRQSEKMADGDAKPRNLGERAKMYAAKKLKSKGKIK